MKPFVPIVLRAVSGLFFGSLLVVFAASLLGTVLPSSAPLFAHVFIGVTASLVMIAGLRRLRDAVLDLAHDASEELRRRSVRDIEVSAPTATPDAL